MILKLEPYLNDIGVYFSIANVDSLFSSICGSVFTGYHAHYFKCAIKVFIIFTFGSCNKKISLSSDYDEIRFFFIV